MSLQPYSNMSYRQAVLLREHEVDSKSDASRRRAMEVHQPAASLESAESPNEQALAPEASWYIPFKGCLDMLLGLVMLVLLSPVLILGALLVKLTSRGPAFYGQVRLGKDGKPFKILKLRTMVQDAEAKTGPVWSTGHDSRITPLGRILRSTHIDEFPQLINVVLGQMSLVGPRPERPEFVAKLEWEIPYYRERLAVRPGITGLAQLRLPPDSDIESVRRKVVHDLYYIRHVSPWLDLRLLTLTAWSLTYELTKFAWGCIALPSQQTIENGFRTAVGLDADDERPTRLTPVCVEEVVTAGSESEAS